LAAILKRYLGLIYAKPACGVKTWQESAEEDPNTCWPGPGGLPVDPSQP